MLLRECRVIQEPGQQPFNRCCCSRISSCCEVIGTVLEPLFAAIGIPQVIGDHPLILFRYILQDRSSRMYLAHLPRGTDEGRCHGCLDPPMAVRDDQLHSLKPSIFEIIEKPGPERLVLAVGDRGSEDLAIPILTDAGGHQQSFRDIPGTVTDGVVRGIEKEIRDRPFEWSRQELLYLPVEVLGDTRDRRRGELIDPQMGDDRLDLPGRDALEIRLGDRVHQGLLDTGVPSKDLSLEGTFSERLRKGDIAVQLRASDRRCRCAVRVSVRSWRSAPAC